MIEILVPVSLGEIADKMSILEVKSRKIVDQDALENVLAEKEALTQVCSDHSIDFGKYLDELVSINEKLWDILQQQRDMEIEKRFGDEFADISMRVYKMNDQRFSIKKRINEKFGSSLKEEKQYD